MVVENSGKIYVIPLNFDLGYALCKFVDYTDIAPFDGALVYILNMQFKDLEMIPSIKELDKLKVLFGPVPLNKYPNIKGKGAWKNIGKTEKLHKKIPAFKDTNHIIILHKAIDWSTVGSWKRRHDFIKGGDYCDYEVVRGLEMLILYDMRKVETRASMHFLLLNKNKVEDYYDLTDERYRSTYLQMVNTSFDRKEAARYLKVVELNSRCQK